MEKMLINKNVNEAITKMGLDYLISRAEIKKDAKQNIEEDLKNRISKLIGIAYDKKYDWCADYQKIASEITDYYDSQDKTPAIGIKRNAEKGEMQKVFRGMK